MLHTIYCIINIISNGNYFYFLFAYRWRCLTLQGLKMLWMCKYNQGPWGLFILKETNKVGQNDDSACTTCPLWPITGLIYLLLFQRNITLSICLCRSFSWHSYHVKHQSRTSLQSEIRLLTLYLPLVCKWIKIRLTGWERVGLLQIELIITIDDANQNIKSTLGRGVKHSQW